jgi:hypothetical protein
LGFILFLVGEKALVDFLGHVREKRGEELEDG